MNEESQNSSLLQLSYQHEEEEFIPMDPFQDRPEISKEEHRQLPRNQRIYYSLRWPRYYPMSHVDAVYFEKVQIAYNILFSADSEIKAQIMIKNAFIGKKLSALQSLELIQSAKELFGKIQIRDTDFDRMMLRHRLNDLVQRARLQNDLKNERLAIKQLAQLDALEVRKKDEGKPEIPILPPLRIVTDAEPAIIESIPVDEEE